VLTTAAAAVAFASKSRSRIWASIAARFAIAAARQWLRIGLGSAAFAAFRAR
jgi:hypothetical protein